MYCGQEGLTTLDGSFCPCGAHYVCDECLDGWAKSEVTPADEHAAKHQVWCPLKGGPDGGGCASDRPYTAHVRALARAPLPLRGNESTVFF